MDVPYYIFQGRKDENTPVPLIQEYYDFIAAPDKDLIRDLRGHSVRFGSDALHQI